MGKFIVLPAAWFIFGISFKKLIIKKLNGKKVKYEIEKSRKMKREQSRWANRIKERECIYSFHPIKYETLLFGTRFYILSPSAKCCPSLTRHEF